MFSSSQHCRITQTTMKWRRPVSSHTLVALSLSETMFVLHKVMDGLFVGNRLSSDDPSFILTNKVEGIINCSGMSACMYARVIASWMYLWFTCVLLVLSVSNMCFYRVFKRWLFSSLQYALSSHQYTLFSHHYTLSSHQPFAVCTLSHSNHHCTHHHTHF